MKGPAVKTLYTVQDIPGKGKGVVAARKIPKGTRIMSEEPLLRLPKKEDNMMSPLAIRYQLKALSKEQQDAFMSLHNAHSFRHLPEQYVRIFETNCLPMDDVDEIAIFLEAARLNHDCDYNASFSWNGYIKRHVVHVLRDIQPGEEITISYHPSLRTRDARLEALQKSFNFTCVCRLCSLPDEQSQARDRILEKISHLGELLKAKESMPPHQALGYLHAQTRLWIELGREDSGFAMAHLDAMTLSITYGDLARARVFAQKALSVYKTVRGMDSCPAIVCNAAVEDPALHPKYGFSTIWNTSMNQTPRGLGHDDFENWLWEREKPAGPAQSLSPPRKSLFPGFVDLPRKNGIDAGDSSKNTRLCFLGVIISVKLSDRLEFEIMDIHRETIPLHFYTKGLGSEMPPSLCYRDNTVAILDASQDVFQSGTPGIRIEDPQKIKIFPYLLDRIISLNNNVREFSLLQDNGMRKCHGCYKSAAAATMKRCGRCSLYWYCSKLCQMFGWTANAHQVNCKALKDPDLRALCVIKWDEEHDFVRFPLKLVDGPS
ncbi:hypothetical protein E4U30_004679 [Claviceps sp. LM220 group G6]|nr:hypothetical protein E4U30_004679 [Claviceps sp. LM220 group G6]